MYLQPIVIAFEPRPYLTILVVRGVVLHENSSAATVVRLKHLQEREVCLRVEHRILFIKELGAVDLNSPKDLHALACSSHGDFGRVPDWAPRCVERGVLAETCLVSEDECPVLSLRFFFRFG